MIGKLSFILSVFMVSIALLGCDMSSESESTVSDPGFSSPSGIAVAPDGDFVAVDSRAVLNVDQTTGDRTILSSNSFFSPHAIAVATDGDFVVVGSGAVVRVDQTTGDIARSSPMTAQAVARLASLLA